MKSIATGAHPEGTVPVGNDDRHRFIPYPHHAGLATEMAGWLSLLRRTSPDLYLVLEPLSFPEQEEDDLYEEVLTSYHAWLEGAALAVRWRTLAAHSEVYPERNIWYLEEILHLVGAIPLVGVGVTNAYAIVIAHESGRSVLLDAMGVGPDEAIESLYWRVYDYLYGP